MRWHSRVALGTALAMFLLPTGGPAWSQAAAYEPANSQPEKKAPESKKDEGRRPVTITVKVTGAGSVLADASVLVTNERSYDTTHSTNADGVATFASVPRDHIEIIVTAKGWKNARKDLQAGDIGTGAAVTVPILLTK